MPGSSGSDGKAFGVTSKNGIEKTVLPPIETDISLSSEIVFFETRPLEKEYCPTLLFPFVEKEELLFGTISYDCPIMFCC